MLLAASHLARPDDLPALTARAGRVLGAEESVLYVVDYDQILLVPLTGGEAVAREPLGVEGTLAGRAFSEVALQQGYAGPGTTVWAPLLDGAERLGVVELWYPEGRELDGATAADISSVAALLAELVMTRSNYGDALEQARRRLPMALPAELQWNLLPPLTFATPGIAVAGVLAPTNEVAGDSFDYAVNADVAHLALLDAMGHGLQAAMLATVAVGALRNARRSGLDLVDTVRSMDKFLSAAFGVDTFVTAIVGELDLHTGRYRWINCGHPPALVVRRGQVVKTLSACINPPLGLLTNVPDVGEERLEPGDRLLLYSDGVIEARDAGGAFFGTQRLVDFVTRESGAGRPAPETLRRLNLSILAHQEGSLQDDATTLMVEWRGEEPARMQPD
jgi:phosphoserine phosphatase RsbU/P